MPTIQLPVVIKNSPIEFIISGPDGGRDRIFIRSEGAGLDLVALAIQSNDRVSYQHSDPLSVLFGGSRQLNMVTSIPMPDIRPDTDSRRSRFNFAWKGLSSSLGVSRVREALDYSLPELYKALESGDQNDIELGVASIVLACTDANERRLRSQRILQFGVGVYVFIGIVGFVYYMLVHMKLS